MITIETIGRQLQQILPYLAICAGSALLLAILLLVVLVRQVRRLQLPTEMDFTTTLQQLPLLFVIALDLLDLSLDLFSVPFVWLILDYLNLKSLRNVATVEALIPFTGPIPTLTLAWIGVNYLKVRF